LRALADEEYEDYVEVGAWDDRDFIREYGEPLYDNGKGKARALHISTDWIEHRDAHGLEKHEPTKNIELLHLPDYDHNHDSSDVVRAVLAVVHSPFHSVLSMLNSDHPPSNLLATILASPSTPLYTALVLAPGSPITPQDQTLISEISAHIPLVVFPPLPPSLTDEYPDYSPPTATLPFSQHKHLSSVSSPNPEAFRNALLRSSGTLSTLRLEAVDRFLRWREIERGVCKVLSLSTPTLRQTAPKATIPKAEAVFTTEPEGSVARPKWDKRKWEIEWEGTLSTEVVRTVRQRRRSSGNSHPGTRPMVRRTTGTPKTMRKSTSPAHSPTKTHFHAQVQTDFKSRRRRPLSPRLSEESPESTNEKSTSAKATELPIDPLHFPSLLDFSLSLIAPLGLQLLRTLRLGSPEPPPRARRGAAQQPNKSSGFKFGFIIGAFCAGFGLGCLFKKLQLQLPPFTQVLKF